MGFYEGFTLRGLQHHRIFSDFHENFLLWRWYHCRVLWFSLKISSFLNFNSTNSSQFFMIFFVFTNVDITEKYCGLPWRFQASTKAFNRTKSSQFSMNFSIFTDVGITAAEFYSFQWRFQALWTPTVQNLSSFPWNFCLQLRWHHCILLWISIKISLSMSSNIIQSPESSTNFLSPLIFTSSLRFSMKISSASYIRQLSRFSSRFSVFIGINIITDFYDIAWRSVASCTLRSVEYCSKRKWQAAPSSMWRLRAW